MDLRLHLKQFRSRSIEHLLRVLRLAALYDFESASDLDGVRLAACDASGI